MKRCPVCQGTGLIEKPLSAEDSEVKRRMVRVLVNEGFSYRQVMKFLGWKSPRSVSVALGRDT